MRISDIAFMYGNLLHALAGQAVILREAIQRTRNEEMIKLLKWQNQLET